MDTLPALSHEVWKRTPPEAQAYIRALEARVATLEGMGQEAFKALAERFPALHLTVDEQELEYQPTLGFRSLQSLPVSWN